MQFKPSLFGGILFASGVWGAVLSFLFNWLATNTAAGSGWSGGVDNKSALFAYYLINSLLIVAASIFLHRKNKAGFVLLTIATVSILGSLFVDVTFDNHYGPYTENLFWWTVGGGNIIWGGSYIFLGGILINLVALPWWLKSFKSQV